ncbi:MAG: Phosphate-import permease protein PhnE [Dehalococcoidia bacterium]|nr:Phosphate-import permease protein PhnE [Bacillota bacterium]MBT9139899.1 Phosphate-import permease protein PhnE [Bacillota bacterium]
MGERAPLKGERHIGLTKRKLFYWILLAGIVLGWSIQGTGVGMQGLITGLPAMASFLAHAFPPDFSKLPEYLLLMVETLHIGLWATFLAVGLSVPLSLLAAQNTTPRRGLSFLARSLLDAFRSLPDLVVAVLFVVAVGLGPFAGVLALTVHATSLLGRFYADEIEVIDPGPVEALQSTGASRLQTIAFAVIPQVLPTCIAFTLYVVDHCIRMATVLGIVGAGGIGLALVLSMRLFEYSEAAAIIIVIFITISLLDKLSNYLRRRII